ncbi:MAG: OadG family protein [Clostridiales bacterium]|jgi:Na+-transporting methylmalonyl-CoA/oxaloacetate decarboxylase gamma subunit|nr:OadG family protein [Clostridiales bacterium]
MPYGLLAAAQAQEELKIGEGFLVVILGILVVFLILVLLVFVIKGFKALDIKLDSALAASKETKRLGAAKKRGQLAAPETAPKIEAAEQPVLLEAGESGKIIAAITAAIAAVLDGEAANADGKVYKSRFIVRDIRKIG